MWATLTAVGNSTESSKRQVAGGVARREQRLVGEVRRCLRRTGLAAGRGRGEREGDAPLRRSTVRRGGVGASMKPGSAVAAWVGSVALGGRWNRERRLEEAVRPARPRHLHGQAVDDALRRRRGAGCAHRRAVGALQVRRAGAGRHRRCWRARSCRRRAWFRRRRSCTGGRRRTGSRPPARTSEASVAALMSRLGSATRAYCVAFCSAFGMPSPLLGSIDAE